LGQPARDDGFHEIQLNGKQLVFLFMAATVVSVVIFLCGVLVGRGVRAERGAAGEATAMNEAPAADVSPPAISGAASAPVPAGSDPTSAPPPPTVDDLSYFKRLEQPHQPSEKLKPTVSPPAPVAAPPAAKEPAPQAPVGASPPPGPGYAVQVAALNVRREADAIAKRLALKGYDAYVLTPVTGTPAVYRVRVGSFKTKHEADTIAAKLQKEEQFKPWVTR
jgi:cell division septation protein DedD